MSPNVSFRLLATQSDRRLLELVGNGHERAFEALVRRYRGELLRYCRRLGLSDSRAEDALQHALLQAWLAIERGVEVRQLRPWLYRIVHNTALNHVRRLPEDSPLAEVASVESSIGAAGELERAMAVRDTLTDVAALPPMQREAILLSAVDGRSHEEVASVLGITDGAVRGLLYRARASLRTAAAALTPQPLIGWLYGNAARVAPSAERLAEISAQGGAGASAGGFAFRGVAVALTAAMLAGGVAVAPLHKHSTHPVKTPSHSKTLALAGAGTSRTSTRTVDGGRALSRLTPTSVTRRHGGSHHELDKRSHGRRHDGQAPREDALVEQEGSTLPASGELRGDGSSGKRASGRTPTTEPERSGDHTRDGGRDGGRHAGSGAPDTPGAPAPQPMSSSGDGSRGTDDNLASAASSGSGDSSGSGSSRSSDDRGSSDSYAISADTEGRD
ncbi:MAG TPA: RNA polymerase sigma factor [Solirubrobacteraceae bacterium]|nr:RNA polymerase sigma factor [Solirubrobacteraceae bacterium]